MVRIEVGVRSAKASVLRRLGGASALALALGAGLTGAAFADLPKFGVPTSGGTSGPGAGAGLSTAAYQTSGQYTTTTTDVTIGQPGSGGLSYTRSFLGNGWRDSITGTLTDNGAGMYTVSVGATAESFTLSGGVYTSNQAMGSTLTFDGSRFYTYTARDGTVMVFDNTLATSIGMDAKDGMLTQATAPNGAVTTYTYRTLSLCLTAACGVHQQATRLQSVTNTYGYMLKPHYLLDSATLVGDAPNWQSISTVTGINLAVDYCDPSADACSGLTASWPQVSYTALGSGAFTTTDMLGRVTRYTYDSQGRMIGIRRPTSPSADNVTLAYNPTSGQLSTYVDANGTTSYSYGADGAGNPKVTITDPLGHSQSVVSSAANGQMVSAIDGLGHTTTSGYDSFGRLTSVVQPEGNSVALTLDGRGNTTVATQTPKAGSGLGVITTSAAYDATCLNPKTCNQPNTTTDGRGAVTTYTYDPTHGGVTSVTQPAPGPGLDQPRVGIGYSALNAYFKNAAGAITAGPAIYLPAFALSCITGSSCSGTAQQGVVSFGYGSAGVANNLQPTIVNHWIGDSSVLSISTLAYDNVGNLTSVDGPLAGTADTTVYRYDGDRELIGIVGPDPDGAGPLHNRATRITYNADGQPTLVEQGTTPDQSDTGWSLFSALQSGQTVYDSVGRKIEDALFSGGTQLTATQYGYYADNRLAFTAVRMNPATFSALPGAGTLATTGADGPDRITELVYDAAGHVTQQVVGFGTAGQRNEAVYTYSNNGLQQTTKDGNNNLTTLVYDGFDRLSQVQFPSPTLGAGTSNTSDFEQYGYDANGNVTSDRRRDGTVLILAYDALNRMTSGPRGEIYTYNNFGQPTSISLGGGSSSVAYAYDALGRKTSDSTFGLPVTYQYDAAGNRTQITYPDGYNATYDYDLAGEMTAVWEGLHATELVAYGYDDFGRRTVRSNGNGTSTSYSYDAASNLSGLAHSLGGAGSLGQTMAYNVAGQLKSLTGTNPAYTPAPAVGSKTFGVNGLNQLTSIGSASVSYYSKGELSSDGTKGYGYDVLGNLTSVSGASLTYDATGRLQATSGSAVTQFQYEGSNLILEYDASGTILRRYVPGAAVDEPVVWYEGSGLTDRRWLTSDRQGSIMAVTDGSGSPLIINQYDEYGVPNATNAGRFQYTGQAWIPEAGVYHYKARAYSPTLGRFLQPDPIGYGDGLNFYNYVHGDPVNGWDPYGLQSSSISVNSTDCQARGQTPERDENGNWTCVGGGGSAGAGPTGGGGNGGSGITEITVIGKRQPKMVTASVLPLPRISWGCVGESLADNGLGLLLDGGGLALSLVPGGSLAFAGVGLGLTAASLVNSAFHHDVVGIGLGTTGYHVGALAAAAPQLEAAATRSGAKFLARSIPGVGVAVGVISVGVDVVNSVNKYNDCLKGK